MDRSRVDPTNDPADGIRATGTWVLTTDGWFTSVVRITKKASPARLVVYDHEGNGQREFPREDVLRVERVESEALYNGHWIPLVATWRVDETPVRAPLPPRQPGLMARLYYDSGPDFDAIASLPRAEVHDPRALFGGVSLLIPLTEIESHRETVTPLDVAPSVGAITREAVLEAIRREGLRGYRWFEDATNQTDVVAIARAPDVWAVFATDERANPVGHHEFASEGAALESFLSRLRAANRVIDRRSHGRGRPMEAEESISVRYFVREHLIEGRLLPVRLFRRRMDATGPTDEYLADVSTWAPDTRGVLDRAIRFSLDSDLEEISPLAADDVIDMVATRTYVPLRRR